MKRAIAVVATIVFLSPCPLYADYSFQDRGTWPESWPKELEGLRKQSRTLVGNRVLNRHYAIPFTKREAFEAAWPHILEVKSKGTSIRLIRGPNFFLGGDSNAGVVIRCPPRGGSDEPSEVWLVVDGDIVDLNRIPLPPDTPIADERFKAE